MRIAVAGGTGVVGRHVVPAAAEAGHEPVVVARSRGVDVTTGRGLEEALAGVHVVIDVSNVTTTRRRRSAAFFTTATGHLLAAGRHAGVSHHVAPTIVGIDRVDFGYYEGKRIQEELVLSGPPPASVLRATQFHEFAGQVLARSRGPVALVPRMRTQPVAAREVATALVALTTGPAVGLAPALAGPQVHELVDLARQVVAVSGRRRPVVPARRDGRWPPVACYRPARDPTGSRRSPRGWTRPAVGPTRTRPAKTSGEPAGGARGRLHRGAPSWCGSPTPSWAATPKPKTLPPRSGCGSSRRTPRAGPERRGVGDRGRGPPRPGRAALGPEIGTDDASRSSPSTAPPGSPSSTATDPRSSHRSPWSAGSSDGSTSSSPPTSCPTTWRGTPPPAPEDQGWTGPPAD